MGEESASIGQSRSTPALGDVTNRIGIRGISGRKRDGDTRFLFSDKDAVKRMRVSLRPCSEINSLKGNVISGLSKIFDENSKPNMCVDGDGVHCLKGKNDGCDKDKILDPHEANVVTLSVHNNDLGGQIRVDPNLADLEGEKVSNSTADGCSRLDSLKEANIAGTAEVANENRCSSIDYGMYDAIQSVNTEANSELGEGSHADTSRTVSETGNDSLYDGEENISPEGNDVDDCNADNFVLSQSGSVDCTFLPLSQESRVFGIDKSNALKDEECGHMTMGTNAINSCSCSFCTKAAYIWLDLHQKDIKARLSALKRSQKEASILAERSCRIKTHEKQGAESVIRANKLESHLMHRWRSLFQHTADLWEAESNQLETSLLPLNNLKDKCKCEMELINAKLPDK